jgi:hypothetical protein
LLAQRGYKQVILSQPIGRYVQKRVLAKDWEKGRRKNKSKGVRDLWPRLLGKQEIKNRCKNFRLKEPVVRSYFFLSIVNAKQSIPYYQVRYCTDRILIIFIATAPNKQSAGSNPVCYPNK